MASMLVRHESLPDTQKRLESTPLAAAWKKVGVKRHDGICVPVFSLKSANSSGCGEYLDLLPLLEWAKENGLDVLQTLPLNETNNDNSPFSPISSFALNPLLLSLHALPHQELATPAMQKLRDELRALNDSHRIDWQQVREKKTQWLRGYYEVMKNNSHAEDAGLKEYCTKNNHWLQGYALFCILKAKYNWKSWKEWDEQLLFDQREDELSNANVPTAAPARGSSSALLAAAAAKQPELTPKTARAFPVPPAAGATPAAPASPGPPNFRRHPSVLRMDRQPTLYNLNPTAKFFKFADLLLAYKSQMPFYYFIQYLCHQQMSQVKAHANNNQVQLKGDIPFLVSPDSADVWQRRFEFRLRFSVGAPPDDENPKGQDWGLPLYNWEVMRQNNFDWWKKRLEAAAQYFDLYRIDHIVGFFRVWAIPNGKQGNEGEYQPAEEGQQLQQGRELLSVLTQFAPMLPIGEDLGAVPPAVRQVLQQLGISGTKVLRWEREWEKDGQPFIPVEDFNADSMTTVSTHDSETLSQWWINHSEEAEAWCKSRGTEYAKGSLMGYKERQTILRDCNHSASLFHVPLLSEYMAFVPWLIHVEPALERINVPGTVAPSNWSMRQRRTVDEIRANHDLKNALNDCR